MQLSHPEGIGACSRRKFLAGLREAFDTKATNVWGLALALTQSHQIKNRGLEEVAWQLQILQEQEVSH